MPESVPAEYEPQPWLKPYSKTELQWLCQQLHDRNTRTPDRAACRTRTARNVRIEREGTMTAPTVTTDANGDVEEELPTTELEDE